MTLPALRRAAASSESYYHGSVSAAYGYVTDLVIPDPMTYGGRTSGQPLGRKGLRIIFNCTALNMITNSISIKNEKKVHFFMFGVPGGRNHPHSYHYKYSHYISVTK